MEPTRILIVEDTPADAEFAEREIRQVLTACTFQNVETRPDYLAALETFRPDLILTDYSMPHFDGMAALQLALERVPLTPVIIWTGSLNEDTAVACMKAGATNYVIKENIKRLGPAVVHALEEKQLRLERQRMEESLRWSEQRHRALVEAIPDLMFRVDRDGTLVDYKADDLAKLIVPPEAFLGKKATEVLPRALAQQCLQAIQALRETGRRQTFEYRLELGGQMASFEARVAAGARDEAIFIVRDITERTRTEEALRESEEQFRTFVEQSSDGLVMTDELGVVIRWNQAMERISGIPRAQVLGVPLANAQHQIGPPEKRATMDVDRTARILRQALATGQSPFFDAAYETRIQTAVGELKHIQQMSFPIKTDQGYRLGAIFRDITERKRAEEAVQRVEARYRALIEKAPDGVVLVSAEGKFVYASPSSLDKFGFTPDEVAQYDPAQLTHPEDLPQVLAVLGEILQDPSRVPTIQYRFRHKDGTWSWIESTFSNLIAEPSVEAIVINFRDITERKHAEEQLREREEIYSAIVNQAVDSIVLIATDDGRFVEFNEAAHRNLGYTREEFAQLRLVDIEAYESAAELERHIQGILQSGTAVFETRLRRKEGEVRDMRVSVRTLELGGRTYLTALWVDVTERNRAEEERGKLAALVDTSPAFVALASLDGQVQFVNPAGRALTGLHAADVTQLNVSAFVAPADASWLGTVMQSVMRDGRWSGEGELQNLETHQAIPMQIEAFVIPHPHTGLPMAIGTFQQDITERKRHETQVRLDVARVEALARVASRLNAQLELDTVLKAVCEETTRALNVPAAAVLINDEERRVLAVAALTGLPPRFQSDHIPTPRARYEEYARKLGSVFVVPDLQAEPGLSNAQLYAEMNVHTSASASMVREGQLIGTLTTLSFEVRSFREDELLLLKGLADEAAQAISNARLYVEAERRLEQMQALNRIDTVITSSLDLQLTLQVFLDETVARLHVDAADVLICDPDSRILEFAAARGFDSHARRQTRLRLGEGFAGRAALERRMVTVADLSQEPGGLIHAPRLASEGFVGYIAVPLMAKGDVKGVLELFHRVPIQTDHEWLQFLSALATQAAIAIDNATLFANLQRSNAELVRAYDEAIQGWSSALDLRDQETQGHSERVTEMTLRLAHALGVPEAELVHFRRGALLHDIGKMGVPDAILFKPDQLTDQEWQVMRKHPVLAFQMLAPIAYLRSALDIPYCHHEKWDGTGYPRGLKGEEIPLAARIFAVVDVWDALTSERPYRSAWSHEKALVYIQDESGKHFDPCLVRVFLQLVNEEE